MSLTPSYLFMFWTLLYAKYCFATHAILSDLSIIAYTCFWPLPVFSLPCIAPCFDFCVDFDHVMFFPSSDSMLLNSGANRSTFNSDWVWNYVIILIMWLNVLISNQCPCQQIIAIKWLVLDIKLDYAASLIMNISMPATNQLCSQSALKTAATEQGALY